MVMKTAILDCFSRVGEIWVAAQEHSGSVKRSSRAGLAWKKRGNGSVASARDAKTGVSRFGDHAGVLQATSLLQQPASTTSARRSGFLLSSLDLVQLYGVERGVD